MRNWYRVFTVSAVALTFVAGGAFAQTTAPADKPASKPPAERDAAKDKTPSAAPRAGAAENFKGRHTMTGEVTKLDKEKGMVSLKTKEGDLDLHFPPAALKDVKEGDRLTVQFAFREEAGGAASPAMEKRKPAGKKKQ